MTGHNFAENTSNTSPCNACIVPIKGSLPSKGSSSGVAPLSGVKAKILIDKNFGVKLFLGFQYASAHTKG
jgi:hypothetical protein